MELILNRGDELSLKFNKYLVPYKYDTMELVSDAPKEALEARDEYLKWREEYQRNDKTFDY